MKKLATLTILAMLVTSCCLSQLPTQYVYVDQNCEAALIDYTSMLIISDNCNIQEITQLPIPNSSISQTETVIITATDISGNTSTMIFEVVVLDTIPPTIMLDPEWTGYTNREVGDMYRTFYGWVQLQEHLFRDNFPFEEWPGVDSSSYFVNVIQIPDTIRSDWWWATNYFE